MGHPKHLPHLLCAYVHPMSYFYSIPIYGKMKGSFLNYIFIFYCFVCFIDLSGEEPIFGMETDIKEQYDTSSSLRPSQGDKQR